MDDPRNKTFQAVFLNNFSSTQFKPVSVNCFVSCDELFHVQQFLLFPSQVTCFACFYTACFYTACIPANIVKQKVIKSKQQTNKSNKQTKHMTKQTKTSKQTNIKQQFCIKTHISLNRLLYKMTYALNSCKCLSLCEIIHVTIDVNGKVTFFSKLTKNSMYCI